MRRKRHKATRRALRFFRINHGFREPYKVSRWWHETLEQKSSTFFVAIEMSKSAPLSLSLTSPLLSVSLSSRFQVLLDGNFVHALRETK